MSEPNLQVEDDQTANMLDEIERLFRGGAVEEHDDRRKNERRSFKGRIMVQPCDGQGRMLAPPWEAQARDLSLWGIRLISPSRVEVGQFLGLSFPIVTRGRRRTVLMLGEVRHVRSLLDGRFSVGCAFRETLSSVEGT